MLLSRNPNVIFISLREERPCRRLALTTAWTQEVEQRRTQLPRHEAQQDIFKSSIAGLYSSAQPISVHHHRNPLFGLCGTVAGLTEINKILKSG